MTEQSKSSSVWVVVAWLVVLIPMGWGLSFTLQNAAKLFTNAAPAAIAPVSPAK